MKLLAKTQERIILASPAKINLFLKVIRKRDDGYHDLVNIMHKISLCDRVIIERTAEPGICIKAEVAGTRPEENIVCLAAKSFYEKTCFEPGIRIDLQKNIPVGGGLGGGSSDAAAVLQGLNRLYGFPLQPAALYEIALKLGADVPFFLKKGTWVMTGRGDVFFKKWPCAPFYFLLYNFGHKSHTGTIYSLFSSSSHGFSFHSLVRLKKGLMSGIAGRVRKEILNDLLPSYLKAYPEQRQIYIDLQKKMCKNLFLSGSGSTLFSIFDRKSDMKKAYLSLKKEVKKHTISATSF